VRKQVTGSDVRSSPTSVRSNEDWLDVEGLARVEVSSEDEGHPIEAALLPGRRGGWRAAHAGEQTIRVIFDRPQSLRRIALVFEEHEAERSQELVLRWRPEGHSSFREIVRQQWNFSPSGSPREAEDYRVDLGNVSAIELVIVPDRSGGQARASLMEWRMA